MEQSGEPLANGDVSVRIVAPSGRAETIRLTASGGEWGAFTGQFSAKEPGSHQATLRCAQTGATLEAKIFVQGAALERIGKPARPEVLEELARVSKGEVLALDKMDRVFETLARLPDPPPDVRRVQLWSHPLVAGMLITLMGLFWIGRKMIGLI
jgi:hypothetical protein